MRFMEDQMDKKFDGYKKVSVWSPFVNQVLDEEEQHAQRDAARRKSAGAAGIALRGSGLVTDIVRKTRLQAAFVTHV